MITSQNLQNLYNITANLAYKDYRAMNPKGGKKTQAIQSIRRNARSIGTICTGEDYRFKPRGRRTHQGISVKDKNGSPFTFRAERQTDTHGNEKQHITIQK